MKLAFYQSFCYLFLPYCAPYLPLVIKLLDLVIRQETFTDRYDYEFFCGYSQEDGKNHSLWYFQGFCFLVCIIKLNMFLTFLFTPSLASYLSFYIFIYVLVKICLTGLSRQSLIYELAIALICCYLNNETNIYFPIGSLLNVAIRSPTEYYLTMM